jgi:hypothetical protein
LRFNSPECNENSPYFKIAKCKKNNNGIDNDDYNNILDDNFNSPKWSKNSPKVINI